MSRKRVYEILEKATPGDTPSLIIDTFLICIIILSVIAVMLETVEPLASNFKTVLEYFEIISVSIFTLEYFLRLWSCTANPQYPHPVWGRLRYAFTFFALVDLIAVLPFYLSMLVVLDLRFVRIVRLCRFIRILKIGRYSKAVVTVGRVFHAKKEELLIAVCIIVLLLIIASSLMYFAEHETQPKEFSSIPAAMWWAAATLSTVGYGDVYPVTFLGKSLGMVIAILGIGLFALPVGILGSGFIEEMQSRQQNSTCPHCGKAISDSEPSNGLPESGQE